MSAAGRLSNFTEISLHRTGVLLRCKLFSRIGLSLHDARCASVIPMLRNRPFLHQFYDLVDDGRRDEEPFAWSNSLSEPIGDFDVERYIRKEAVQQVL